MSELGSFEDIILKKLTSSGEFFGKVVPILEPKFFSAVGTQELFKLMKRYYAEYKSIPSLTELVAQVKNVSNAEIRAEIIGSLQRVNKIEDVQNIEFLCNETVSWVKDAMYMESLQIGSEGLMNKDDELKSKAKQIMENMSKVCIDSDLGLNFDDIGTMIEYYSARNIGVLTQHKELNARLGAGFLPGTLSVILASQGVGKCSKNTDFINIYVSETDAELFRDRLNELRSKKNSHTQSI